MTNSAGRVLIIDDDRDIQETLESLIRRLGHKSFAAGTLQEGLRLLDETRPDVVFLDIRLPDGNGLKILPDINSRENPPEVIIITGMGDPDGAELAIQGGAWDYVVKPSSIKNISLTLKRALAYHKEKQGSKTAPVALNLDSVVGKSPEMHQAYDLMALAASSDSNVLITGETGTGKELFARAIHVNSSRRAKDFVVVDCASLTETLVESTLFGHRKGAFTGAHSDQQGLVRLAHLGTLFLDEVGEMPMSVQKSFLRVLQERCYRPVGETREVCSDFRLISATNRDLKDMVTRGEFREDLWFRLKTIHLPLPTLRRRTVDIPELTLFFLGKLCAETKSQLKGIDPDFFEALAGYEWPGNVRELFSVLERAFVASGGEPTLYPLHLPHELRIKMARRQLESRLPAPQDRTETLNAPPLDGEIRNLPEFKIYRSQAERIYLETLLRRMDTDISRMVSTSGVSRSHLYALFKKHGLTP